MQYSAKYVYRMMSQKEYDDLLAGRQLTNTTVHDPENKFSYSTGFCFLPWEVVCLSSEQPVDKLTALQAIDRLLPGVLKYDVWVQLKVLNPHIFKKSLGCYLDFKTNTEVWIDEVCTTGYSARDLQPMHAFKMEKVLNALWRRGTQ